MNPNNKLGINSKKCNTKRRNRNPAKDNTSPEVSRSYKDNKKTHRVAIARVSVCAPTSSDVLMLESGTAARMTPDVLSFQSKITCNMPIALGDNHRIKAEFSGGRVVTLHHDGHETTVRLTQTLVARDPAMSLLSVPALAAKDIATIFMPNGAHILDLKSNLRALGVASRHNEGLYYMDDNLNTVTKLDTKVESYESSMSLVIENFTQVDASFHSKHRSYHALANKELQPPFNDSQQRESIQNSLLELLPLKSVSKSTTNTNIWHLRLGHVGNQRTLAQMVKSGPLHKPSCL